MHLLVSLQSVYICGFFFKKKCMCGADENINVDDAVRATKQILPYMCCQSACWCWSPVYSGTRSPIVSNLKNLARSSHHHMKKPCHQDSAGPSRTHQCHVKHFRFPQGSCEHPSWSETCRNHANAMVGGRKGTCAPTDGRASQSVARRQQPARHESAQATFVATKA